MDISLGKNQVGVKEGKKILNNQSTIAVDAVTEIKENELEMRTLKVMEGFK